LSIFVVVLLRISADVVMSTKRSLGSCSVRLETNRVMPSEVQASTDRFVSKCGCALIL